MSDKVALNSGFLSAIVIIALIACITVLVALFDRAKNYYNQVNAVRLDPLGLHNFSTPPIPEELKLVFYGDSRAAFWPEPAWLTQQTLNLGIGGQTTEQILGRFNHHLAPLSPDIVLIQAGINDLKAIPLFPNDERTIIERCKKNIGEIVNRSLNQGADVILTTIFPVGKLPLQRIPVWSDRVEIAVAEVNEYIQSLESDRVRVIKSSHVLAGDNGKVKPAYSRDFLHLSDMGYEQLNKSIRSAAQSILAMKDSETNLD